MTAKRLPNNGARQTRITNMKITPGQTYFSVILPWQVTRAAWVVPCWNGLWEINTTHDACADGDRRRHSPVAAAALQTPVINSYYSDYHYPLQITTSRSDFSSLSKTPPRQVFIFFSAIKTRLKFIFFELFDPINYFCIVSFIQGWKNMKKVRCFLGDADSSLRIFCPTDEFLLQESVLQSMYTTRKVSYQFLFYAEFVLPECILRGNRPTLYIY